MFLLQKINKLPEEIDYQAIEDCVSEFVKDSHTDETGADRIGLYNQTIENIAAATIFKHDGSRQFWLCLKEREVVAYALTHISKDVDNSLCYWITQAYIAKKYRNLGLFRKFRDVLVDDAKKSLCRHIMMPSSRNNEVYKRLMGNNTHEYITILKQDI